MAFQIFVINKFLPLWLQYRYYANDQYYTSRWCVRQYEQGISAMGIALSISEGLARNVLSASVNGEIWDASRPIQNDNVKLFTWNDKEENQPIGIHPRI